MLYACLLDLLSDRQERDCCEVGRSQTACMIAGAVQRRPKVMTVGMFMGFIPLCEHGAGADVMKRTPPMIDDISLVCV